MKRTRHRSRAILHALEPRLLFAAGDLDLTFGQGGVNVVGDEDLDDNSAEFVLDAAALPDDGVALLVTGTRRRWEAKDYIIEPGFGVVQVNLAGGMTGSITSYDETPIEPASLTVPSDGRPVLAGSADTAYRPAPTSTERHVAVYRWGVPGAPVVTNLTAHAPGGPWAGVDSYASESLIQPDGKLLVTGGMDVFDRIEAGTRARVFARYAILVRYNPDLTLDRTFGGGDGVVVAGAPAGSVGSQDMVGIDLALAGDGDIVVLAGEPRAYTAPAVDERTYLLRFNSNGSADTAFGGGDGILPIDIVPGRDLATALAIAPGGQVLVAGTSYAGPGFDFVAARFNTDGSRDTKFGGGDGQVRTNIGAGAQTIDRLTDVAVLPGGKFLLAGTTGESEDSGRDFAVARYKPDGSLDTSFGGGDGKAVVNIRRGSDDDSDDYAPALSVLGDGRAVLAGATEYPVGVGAARLLGDSTSQEQVLQAEAARLSGPVSRADNAGYRGTGYADFTNASGDFVEWAVTASAAARHRITFRYANGSTDRPLELRVNGVVVRRVSFPSTGSWAKWGTVFADVPLQGGANTIRITSVGSNGANVDQVAVRRSPAPEPPPPPRERLYQAEAAAIVGAEVHRAYNGYTGDGYVDFVHTSGDSIEWSVTALVAGIHQLKFRYALGNNIPDRPLELKVNGQVVRSRLSFPFTGGWYVWHEVTVDAPLRAGGNTVRLATAGSNGPNVDLLTVTPPPEPPPAQTLQAEDAKLTGPAVRSGNAGYTGGGYADFGDAAGQSIEWAVNIAETRNYVLEFRYANGGGTNRPLNVTVDGSTPAGVSNPLPFAPTGSWTTWRTVRVTVRLTSGQHRIRLESTGRGPNVDSLVVRAA